MNITTIFFMPNNLEIEILIFLVRYIIVVLLGLLSFICENLFPHYMCLTLITIHCLACFRQHRGHRPGERLRGRATALCASLAPDARAPPPRHRRATAAPPPRHRRATAAPPSSRGQRERNCKNDVTCYNNYLEQLAVLELLSLLTNVIAILNPRFPRSNRWIPISMPKLQVF